jgi:hypothetical protein
MRRRTRFHSSPFRRAESDFKVKILVNSSKARFFFAISAALFPLERFACGEAIHAPHALSFQPHLPPIASLNRS